MEFGQLAPLVPVRVKNNSLMVIGNLSSSLEF